MTEIIETKKYNFKKIKIKRKNFHNTKEITIKMEILIYLIKTKTRTSKIKIKDFLEKNLKSNLKK